MKAFYSEHLTYCPVYYQDEENYCNKQRKVIYCDKVWVETIVL